MFETLSFGCELTLRWVASFHLRICIYSSYAMARTIANTEFCALARCSGQACDALGQNLTALLGMAWMSTLPFCSFAAWGFLGSVDTGFLHAE